MKRKASGPVGVCFLIDRLSRAGTESQLIALIRELDRRRVQPSLVLLDGTDEQSRSLEPPDCPVLRLGLTSFKQPRRMLRAAHSLLAFWNEHQTDIVQTYFLDSVYFGVPLARLAGIRRVVRVRNNAGYWLTPMHRWLGRIYSRLVDTTLTNSEAGRKSLIESEHLKPRAVVVLENGVDLDRFAQIPPPRTDRSGVVSVGVVANLRPVKGLDVLIAAAARLRGRYPRLQFQVAGEGEQRPELERLIEHHQLGQCVQLLGSVSDIPAFLARQEIAVLPSRSEGMSNALLEYMAAGRAIVATAVGGNLRLIDPGQHGLLVPPGDFVALADAIEQLLQSPASARAMGQAARQRVEERYSRAAMQRRFETFYEQLAAA